MHHRLLAVKRGTRAKRSKRAKRSVTIFRVCCGWKLLDNLANEEQQCVCVCVCVCVCCAICLDGHLKLVKYCMCWQVIGFLLKGVSNLSYAGHPSHLHLVSSVSTCTHGSHPGSLHYLWLNVNHSHYFRLHQASDSSHKLITSTII